VRIAWVDRVLSLGQSDAIPHRLSRHIRVTNALALFGVALNAIGIPLDVVSAPASIVVMDLIAISMFLTCWWLNARGAHLAARLMLMAATHGLMFGGIYQLGGEAELRSVYFPLAMLPFLVFSSTSDRKWIALLLAASVFEYFVLAYVPGVDHLEHSRVVYRIYAPALAFTMLIAGTYMFSVIDERAQDKLLQARARAAQTARLVALGEVSSGIAHEVRNPLAAIHLAATQIAERPDDTAQVTQLGERIQRIVMRASRTIEAMRAFSRDAGADPFLSTPLDRVIGDAFELCGKHLAERAVELQQPAVPPELTVECRSVQLTQVLVNLINNAYDAVSTASERWVRVEVTSTANTVEIAVVDSGAGIPGNVRQRLFEPFFTTKPADRGTGLGLSLSREIAEAHHGSLRLDAQAPHTRFVMTLPRTQPAVA
jgi:signal transduction histidine kinase